MPLNRALVRGPCRLGGGDFEVRLSGYKHLMPVLLGAALSLGGRVSLANVARVLDTALLRQILELAGATVEDSGDALTIDTEDVRAAEIPASLSARIRGSVYLLPGLLGRAGTCRFGGSGGCRLFPAGDVEPRPVQHLYEILRRFGAEVAECDGVVHGRTAGLKPTVIDVLAYSDRAEEPSGPLVSSATKMAILCALAAEGESRILNPLLLSYSVLPLLDFAAACGFSVATSKREIVIRRGALAREARFTLIPDISTAMTYVVCALYHGFPLSVRGLGRELAERTLYEEIACLERMGAPLDWRDGALHVGVAASLAGVDVEVRNYGFLTDHQPLFSLLLLRADSSGVILDRVFRQRFAYARELLKLGARIEMLDGAIRVHPGRPSRAGQTLRASDVRAAATLLLAALAVDGRTEIDDIGHLERGYPHLIEDLVRLGADIELI